MTTKKTSTIDESLVYGVESQPKKITKVADTLNKALSINAFVEDVSLRFRKDYKDCVQLMVYFFPDKSIYTKHVENTFGSRTVVKDQVFLAPEMLTFVYVIDGKVKRKVHVNDLEVYKKYGICFDTHIPIKNDEKNFRADREIQSDHNVNCLLINTEVTIWNKPKSTFEVVSKIIEYHKWKVTAPSDSRNDSKYMMDNLYEKATQFENISDKVTKSNESDADFEMSSADDDEESERL